MSKMTAPRSIADSIQARFANYVVTGTVRRFSGTGGWVFVAVPGKYTDKLRARRQAWGQYPIIATVGATTWETKLMMKKGGDFFIALREAIRTKENIAVGDTVSVSFTLA